MHTDLMRSSGFWTRFDPGVILPPFYDLEARLSLFAAIFVHNCAMFSADIGVEHMMGCVFVPFRGVFDDGVVDLFNFPLLELCVQIPMCFCGARKNHDSRSDLIQPVHDPNPAEFIFEHFSQNECVLIPALMQDRNPGRLVKHDNGLILVNDI